MTGVVIIALASYAIPYGFAGWMAWLRYREKKLAQARKDQEPAR